MNNQPKAYQKRQKEFYVLRSKRQNSVYNPPEQYLRGYTEFYKLRFKVTSDTLIPRPETELLVDEVLNVIASEAKQSFTVLDIGTGAGNIAISIARNLPKKTSTSGVEVQILATDVSEKALKVAKMNAKVHGVEDKIKFIQSNLLSDIPIHRPADTLIIVTNLPYIPSARIPYLDPSVKDFEPKVALDGGEDGFELYRKLFQQIKEKGLNPNLILGEIDYTHGELAIDEALKYFPQAEVEVKNDLAHKQRILLIRQVLQSS